MDHMDLISHNFYEGYINLTGPIILSAEASQKDNLHLGKSMKYDDHEDSMKAMGKEIWYLTPKDVWEIFPKLSLPTSEKIIRLTRSLKIIKNPFGYLIKHNACLCVHGGTQKEGIDYNNTFTPVINCSIVRLIIMMAEMDGRESRQIDYVLDFSHVPIDRDVYLHLTSVFDVDGKDENETYFIKLKNNLFGTCQSAANWFVRLKTELKYEGVKKKRSMSFFEKQ